MARDRAGLWDGELDGLIGRDDALRRLRTRLSEGGRVVVVLGAAGAGKSALLDVACRAGTADGLRVVRVTGHLSDREIPYAALVDLLAAAGILPPGQDWTARDPLALRLDLLARLEDVAGATSLLLAVEDAQWIDASSLSVLTFLANRLAPSRVSLALTVRGDVPPSGWERHPRIVLDPLDERQSSTLLRRAGLLLSPFARSVVIERAAGNPLALLQLGRISGKRHRVGEMLIDNGSLSDVEHSFAQVLPELPGTTRRTLLLAAAGAADLAVLGRAVGADQVLPDLAPAEAAGLVRVRDRQVRFQHPLARSAVYSSATANERVAAHRQLAEAYASDPDRHIWHRAEATMLPDDEVAAALVEAALRTRARGALVEAARAMTRAAELTTDRRTSEMRMLDAVEFATPTGQFDWMIANATRVRDNTDDPGVRARATHHIAYALAHTWRQRSARLSLLDALEQLVALGTDAGWGSLTTLAALTYQTGGTTAELGSWLERYQREAPTDRGELAAVNQAAEAWIRVVINPLARPPELIELVRHAPSLKTTHPPDLVEAQEMLLGGAAWLLEEHSVALTRFGNALTAMNRTGAGRQLTQTLSGIGQVRMDAGLFDDADEAGRLLCDIAEAENLSYTGSLGAQLRARVAAIRGDTVTATRMLDGMLVGAEVGENLALMATIRVGLAHARLSDNDMPGAYEQFRNLFHTDGRPIHEHIAYHFLGDLASTAVRAGRLDDARTVVNAAEQHIPQPRSVRHQLILARAHGLVATDDQAAAHFEAATAPPQAAQWPFELANARLEYGAWLRRHRNPTAARAQLTPALETFKRLGARTWADLTRAELRAAGVPTPEEATPAWTRLTAQERQVVKLAATGLTNPQIGQLLFLSPRTVSAHLYNAFPKLGVTARSQLRAILEQHDPS
ncbi:LuxR C-terminal-related transcriptional regulator [Micromonospora sp. NPDC049523]|uniref:helix-turn-helix transcriptional regulator n=1 Tax=Micromonospora sp. NPDC049523 TaxID=3155921 RepID=UPI003440525B